MTDQPVTTTVGIQDPDGTVRHVHFQEYWVRLRAERRARAVRFDGVEGAGPAPGVLEAISAADAVLVSPSNPVVSIGPILAVPGIREAIRERRGRVVGVSPIVGGTVLAGMADRLMPVVGLEVSALGAARAYEGLLAGWVVDEADRDLAPKIEEQLGIRVAVTDTVMRDDDVSAALARTTLGLLE
jgi:LPPG:FO 2-phospho-L-lactate transferase